MFDWYPDLSTNERRTFWACYGGWALDAMDAQMFPLVIPSIMATWGLGRPGAGSVAGIALAASALGGWLAGAMADRYGRVRILQLTVACFSLFSLLSAFAQNVRQLALCKALQGLGFGGEWAVGAVLLAEVVQPRHRGKAMGTTQSGWAVGWGGAVLLYGMLSSLLPAQICWRVLFALGVLPALLIFYLQRSIREPSRERPERAAPAASGGGAAMIAIFAPATFRITLIGAILGLGAHGGYYALTTWLPSYLMVERHLSIGGTSAYLAVIIASFWWGCIGASYLLDRLGRRRTVLLFSLCCVATIVAYLFLPVTNGEMLYLGLPLGFFSAGIPASLGALFSEMFPAGMRGTGVGFCYNFGRIASAGFPALVGAISIRTGLGFAIGADAAAGYLLVAAAVLALPETRQRALQV